MDKKTTVTWVASVATPVNWIPGFNIEQIEFEYTENKQPTLKDVEFVVRGKKKFRKFTIIGAIEKG